MSLRLPHLGIVILLTALLSGCYQTPEQRLHGRWYNAHMSLRLRQDGRVSFYSESGAAHGRYVLSQAPTAVTRDTAARVLQLDVVRNGVRLQYRFNVTFLAEDRLRLQDAAPGRSAVRATETAREFVVLRRSVEQLPESRVVTGKIRRMPAS